MTWPIAVLIVGCSLAIWWLLRKEFSCRAPHEPRCQRCGARRRV